MYLKDAFSPFLEYMAAKGLTQKTIEEHKRFLFGSFAHSIADMKISELKLVDVVKVMAAGKSHGEFGPQRSVVTLRRLLKFIKECGHPIPFDWRDVELPKVPQKPVEYLTPEELEKIRASFDINTLPGLRTRALIEVLYDTGMRISEAVSLNREDIDWANKTARVTNAKTKDKGEPVYFTDRSLEWLQKYLDARHDNFPPLFAGYMGDRLNKCTARNILRRTTKELGIKKHIRHHIFRRTLATNLMQSGKVDLKSVQRIMRHKSVRTTLRYYVGIDEERVRALHQEVMGKNT